MSPTLTDEQRQALDAADGVVEIHDDRTQRVYVLVAKDQFRDLIDVELRSQLQIGFDQADRGEVDDWDAEEILSEAHRRYAERNH